MEVVTVGRFSVTVELEGHDLVLFGEALAEDSDVPTAQAGKLLLGLAAAIGGIDQACRRGKVDVVGVSVVDACNAVWDKRRLHFTNAFDMVTRDSHHDELEVLKRRLADAEARCRIVGAAGGNPPA